MGRGGGGVPGTREQLSDTPAERECVEGCMSHTALLNIEQCEKYSIHAHTLHNYDS